MTSSILVAVAGVIRSISPSHSHSSSSSSHSRTQGSKEGRRRRRRQQEEKEKEQEQEQHQYSQGEGSQHLSQGRSGDSETGFETASSSLPSPLTEDEVQKFSSTSSAAPPTVPILVAATKWTTATKSDGIITPPQTATSRRSAPTQSQDYRRPSISFAADDQSCRSTPTTRGRCSSHIHDGHYHQGRSQAYAQSQSHQSQSPFGYFDPTLGSNSAISVTELSAVNGIYGSGLAGSGGMSSMTYVPNPKSKKKDAKPVHFTTTGSSSNSNSRFALRR